MKTSRMFETGRARRDPDALEKSLRLLKKLNAARATGDVERAERLDKKLAVRDLEHGFRRWGRKWVRPTTELVWHCDNCGNREPAFPPYEVGDDEPCVHCGEGTARVERGS